MRVSPSSKTLFVALLLFLGALPASPVQAYFVDGNQLLERVSSDRVQAARFYAYVSAIIDALNGSGLPDIGCFRAPTEATLGQFADTVKLFLDQNPKVRHRNAAELVVTALSQDYPCK